MKHKPRLLFFAASILLTFACLGAPAAADTVIPTSAIPSTGAAATIPAAAAPAEGIASVTPGADASTPTVPLSLPAGLKIAYILNGDAWLWDASASAPARQLTHDGNVTRAKLSSDGKVIVYERNGRPQGGPVPAEELGDSLWAINADGSSPRQLAHIVSYAAPLLPSRGVSLSLYLAQYEFQPGTHWVYFSTAWTGDGYSIASLDLHRVDADAPAPQALLTEGGGEFTFSPGGDRLALASLTDIKVIRADGSGLATALSYPVLSSATEFKPQIVWLSNGTGFYTVLRNDSGTTGRYLFVSGDGSFFAQLAEFNPAPVEISQAIISPDGTKVAYVVQTASSFDLHVIDASTTDVTIASHAGAPLLELWGWSPDSKRVAYWNSHPVFVLTAGINLPSSLLAESVAPYSLRWIDAEHFIFFREGRLLIGQVGNSNVVTVASEFPKNDEFFTFYDFIPIPAP